MTKINDLFGKRIKFSTTLVKRWVDRSNPEHDYDKGINRIWEKVIWPEEREGMIVGIRTLLEGWKSWEHDTGYTFRPVRSVRALVVVVNMYQNPIYIPYDECLYGN